MRRLLAIVGILLVTAGWALPHSGELFPVRRALERESREALAVWSRLGTPGTVIRDGDAGFDVVRILLEREIEATTSPVVKVETLGPEPPPPEANPSERVDEEDGERARVAKEPGPPGSKPLRLRVHFIDEPPRDLELAEMGRKIHEAFFRERLFTWSAALFGGGVAILLVALVMI